MLTRKRLCNLVRCTNYIQPISAWIDDNKRLYIRHKNCTFFYLSQATTQFRKQHIELKTVRHFKNHQIQLSFDGYFVQMFIVKQEECTQFQLLWVYNKWHSATMNRIFFYGTLKINCTNMTSTLKTFKIVSFNGRILNGYNSHKHTVESNHLNKCLSFSPFRVCMKRMAF